jgi:putative hydrolase of the HAD superfamily
MLGIRAATAILLARGSGASALASGPPVETACRFDWEADWMGTPLPDMKRAEMLSQMFVISSQVYREHAPLLPVGCASCQLPLLNIGRSTMLQGKIDLGNVMAARIQNHMRAVIFDYGEVLCHHPTPAEMEQLAAFFSVEVSAFPELWERNRGPFDRGDLTAEAYWSLLARDAGVTIDSDQLRQICELDISMWSNINLKMVEWASQLRLGGIKTGLLSNMHPDMVAHCRENFRWLEHFDHTTFSGDVRLIKPDPAIYQHALRGLGVAATETLFLDDREANVIAAQALGINAIRFHSIKQLRRELAARQFAMLPGLG